MWSLLVRGRFHPVCLTGDLRKAFLQVRVRNTDRDVLRFHWLKDMNSDDIQTLRFTRALFGLTSSPFLSGGVIQQHLENWRPVKPAAVEEIGKSLYVDDLVSGATTTEKASQVKSEAKEIFQDATFELHKWHSNAKELEIPSILEREDETYAKQQLGVPTEEKGKLLGLDWDKEKDRISVTFPSEKAELSKRGILSKVARVFDPLGLVSPTTLAGKLLYREACDRKLGWDAPLDESLAKRWQKWENDLPDSVTFPRSLVGNREDIQEIHLHAFGDASIKGVAAAVYAVVRQPSGDSQGLVAAKSRLAKQGLTIPRLELVSGHMAANLVDNVKEALQGFPVIDVTGWLDSTVALCWIEGQGQYKQFVQNRVRKIQEKSYIKWRHVPTDQNPADIGSRAGMALSNNQLWQNGPDWLGKKESWPPEPFIAENDVSRAETKLTREVYSAAVTTEDVFDGLLGKFYLRKVLRIGAWIARFMSNAKARATERTKGPITTNEIQKQLIFWIRRVQTRNEATDIFQDDQQRVNLQKNGVGIYECRGRLQGHYPTYLPDVTTSEFIHSLKRFIARRGRPKKIYSDNGKTFVAAAKWLRKVMKEERFHNWLAEQRIVWQFNLSRAPWWGGMVGLVKQALYKTVGKAYLKWKELQEVLMDIEIVLNNRPLSYVEEV